ncbi:MAG: SdrD B-like domain-containing protein [Chloroflexota bacterium]
MSKQSAILRLFLMFACLTFTGVWLLSMQAPTLQAASQASPEQLQAFAPLELTATTAPTTSIHVIQDFESGGYIIDNWHNGTATRVNSTADAYEGDYYGRIVISGQGSTNPIFQNTGASNIDISSYERICMWVFDETTDAGIHLNLQLHNSANDVNTGELTSTQSTSPGEWRKICWDLADFDNQAVMTQFFRVTLFPRDIAGFGGANLNGGPLRVDYVHLETAPAINCGASEVGGRIFFDANSNTLNDEGETGYAGANVTIYNAAGVSTTVSTDASGYYSTTAFNAGEDLRVEMAMPTGFDAAAAGNTSVIFTQAGMCEQDIGIYSTDHYCEENPIMATACYVAGLYNGDNAGLDAIVSFPYTATGIAHDGSGTMPVHAATVGDIGTTWGMGYQRQTETLYTTAFVKRLSDLGPLGTGGIYKLDYSNPTSPTVSNFVNISVTLSVDTGPDPRDGTTNNASLPISGMLPVRDQNAYDNVGKVSMGDMDISSDGNTMWFVNLYDQSLYGITNLDPNTTPVPGDVLGPYDIAAQNPGCNAASDVRPWGLKYSNSTVFVGLVCSAESTGATADLHAYVLKFNTGTNTFDPTPAIDFSLTERTGCVFWNSTPDACAWRAWGSTEHIEMISADPNDFHTILNPQPILADIEFDIDGSMVIAFLDRHGHQSGLQNYSGDISDPNPNYGGMAGGDVVRVCNNNGTFELEQGGICPNGNTEYGYGGSISGFNNGIYGTAEYYRDDSVPNNQTHAETASGGLALHLSSGEVGYSTMNPLGNFNSGGIRWNSNTTGLMTRGYELYQEFLPDPTFGKATGIGDVELLCSLPAIEVGNRVWQDTDRDGVQDPGEPAIAGVVIELLNASDTVVMSTTTDANGVYLFSSGTAPISSTTGAVYNVAGLTTGTANFKVRISETDSALAGRDATTPNAQGDSSNSATDLRDSDAVPSSGYAVITFTTGSDGENNHTLDFGFIPYTPPSGPAAQMCTTTRWMASPCFVNGDPLAGSGDTANEPALVVFPYDSVSQPGDANYTGDPIKVANAGQIGATWGAAYRESTQSLYMSAMMKRHAGFGPLGTGGIYRVDLSAISASTYTASVTSFLDLSTLGVNTGDDTRVAFTGYDGGGNVTDPNMLPDDVTVPSWDVDAFDAVGKRSLGDIDLSADGNTLWAVNLFYVITSTNPATPTAPTLVEVDISGDTPTLVGQYDIPDPGCVDSSGAGGVAAPQDRRPWALKVHNGVVYVGMVCSAQTSQITDDLEAHIYAYESGAWGSVFSFELGNINRRPPIVAGGTTPGNWLPWHSSYATIEDATQFGVYPQPILSDIEFDMDGSMILGFIDRNGHQTGDGNYTDNYPSTALIQGISAGDVMRVCNVSGTYVLENNGTCDGVTTDGDDAGDGPGGGEYYWGDQFDYQAFTDPDVNFASHAETSFGGIAFWPGSGEVAITAMNPTQSSNSGGIIWLDNTTGGRNSVLGAPSGTNDFGYRLYALSGAPGSFGKATGLGDLELWCAVTDGTITIVKETVGDNATNTAFGFSSPDGDLAAVSLTTSNNRAVSSVITKTAGTYTITEDLLAGWTFQGVSFDGDNNNDSVADVFNRQAVINLSGGEHITITFTNLADPTPPPVCVDATDDLGGTIWRDYDSDGTQDGSDPGFDGYTNNTVIVSAYDNNGFVMSTTVGITGTYVLDDIFNGRTGDDVHLRLEFSGLPSWLQSGVHGSNSGTTVQYHEAATCDADLGVQNPVDYCETNPELFNTCFVSGDPTVDGQPAEGLTALINFEYDSTGRNSAFKNALATGGEIGAVWGLAYREETQKVYVSAVLRRHAGFGDSGAGGIYEVDVSDLASPSSTAWITLTTAGSVAVRDLTGNSPLSVDTEAYQQVGKLSLGDIDLSEDGDTLYVMNLNNNGVLVAYDVDSKAILNSYPVTDPGCSAATDVRPWGVKVHDGTVYIGVVCSEEASGGQDEDLASYVMALNEGGTFDTVANIPLDYTRDSIVTVCSATSQWHRWNSTPASYDTFVCDLDVGAGGQMTGTLAYPQPLLSDIEFDDDGSLILGLTDRTSLMGGAANYGPDPATGTKLYNAIAGGDILRLCYTAAGTYSAEGNANCLYNGGQSGTTEYYTGDFFSQGTAPAVNFHEEIATGALTLRHGSGEVVTTVFDPLDDPTSDNSYFAKQGVRWLSNSDGSMLDAYEIVGPTDPAFYGKATGLGDLELMCSAAPLEIGNYVWYDEDEDGIQDPCETPIPNVVVALYSITNTLIATTTTDSSGEYYFNDANVTGGLAPETGYQLRIDLAQTAISTYTLTTANVVTTNTTLTDSVDSDGIQVGNNAVISLTTGPAGHNDHSFDFGFVPDEVISFELSKVRNTASPVIPGNSISFTIRITNTGSTAITSLPLTDTYQNAYLTYIGATPSSNSVGDTGTIIWNDLTESPNGFGIDLAPGMSFTVDVEFVAALDTTALVNSETINTAIVFTDTATDAVQIFNPTNVTLADREVMVRGNEVTLFWETVDETTLIGFNIIRQPIPSGAQTQLNDALIIAQNAGLSSGASYKFSDTLPDEEDGIQTYRYLLEMVTNENSTFTAELGTTGASRWSLFLPVLRNN